MFFRKLIDASIIGWAHSANKVKKRTRVELRSKPLSNETCDDVIVVEQTRTRQLKEISGIATPSVSPKERNINLNLAIATATLGVTGIGVLLHSPIILLGLPGIAYNSLPYFRDAYRTIVKEKRLGIGVLDSVVTLACVAQGYFFAATISNFFFYFSRKLLIKTEDLSKKTLTNVFANLPSSAWVVDENNKQEIEVPLDSINIGDTIVVAAGGIIPIDGKIIDGYAGIDQTSLTGESQSAEKAIGDEVLASTIVQYGKIYIRVEKAGKDTVVSIIGEILQQAVNFKPLLQSRGEAIADKSAVLMLALGGIALPLIGANGAIAIVNSNLGINMRSIAPFATLSFLAIASRNGVLVKDGRVFESLNLIDTVVFDKTGTLTIDQPHVRKIYSFDKYSEEELLAIAASVERRQAHPIAKAIQQAAKDRKLKLFEISDAHYEFGHGLQVKLNDRIILVGSDRFMTMKNIVLTEKVIEIQKQAQKDGHSIIIVTIDNQIAGAIELHATVRPEIKDIVKSLKAFGKETYIISGDQEEPTRKLAEDLNIDHYYANTLPANKAKLIDELQKQGRNVCFIGDGINDSIALKQANVSVSLRGASTIAIDMAQVILMDKSLTNLISVFELAKEHETNIKRSFSMTLIPGAVNMCSALFLSSGVILSVILDRVGQFSGVINGSLPRFKKRDLFKEPKRSENV
jgi:Cu2+-exporting ATPase